MIKAPPSFEHAPRPNNYVIKDCNCSAPLSKPSRSNTLTQCWLNVGPASLTLDQHWTNIDLTSSINKEAHITSHHTYRPNTGGSHNAGSTVGQMCAIIETALSDATYLDQLIVNRSGPDANPAKIRQPVILNAPHDPHLFFRVFSSCPTLLLVLYCRTRPKGSNCLLFKWAVILPFVRGFIAICSSFLICGFGARNLKIWRQCCLTVGYFK